MTGIWDATNKNVRVLVAGSIVPVGIASLDLGTSTFSGGWTCVGAACAYTTAFQYSTRWDGQLLRPALFQGVISGAQLLRLTFGNGPNHDPPADEAIGAVLTTTCSQLLTPQNIYDYNPSLAGPIDWTPAAGSAADRAER